MAADRDERRRCCRCGRLKRPEAFPSPRVYACRVCEGIRNDERRQTEAYREGRRRYAATTKGRAVQADYERRRKDDPDRRLWAKEYAARPLTRIKRSLVQVRRRQAGATTPKKVAHYETLVAAHLAEIARLTLAYQEAPELNRRRHRRKSGG